MNQQAFIYKFLLAPQFRYWRYLALILFFTIVSVNQALTGYKNILHLIGNKVYWITFVTILVYIFTILLFQKTIQKYLLTGKYLKFVFYIFMCAVLFEIIPNLAYFLYLDGYDFFSGTTIIDNLSSFTVFLLCILGVIVPVFLRNWLVTNQHLNELQKKQKSSKIEKLKEQINPDSFFKILNRSGRLVKAEPDKASAMLMKLSQLLRYQLYDCNRDEVLLTAEISFIRNYLELENLYSAGFNYRLSTEGYINGHFIYPSILLPYVQAITNALNEEEKHKGINLLIGVDDRHITFIISIPELQNKALLEQELSKIRERLNTLYQDHYSLNVANNASGNHTDICLKLDKY